MRQAGKSAVCPYLVVDAEAQSSLPDAVQMPEWAFLATVRRPTDKNENVLLFKRVSALSTGAQLAERRTDPLPTDRP